MPGTGRRQDLLITSEPMVVTILYQYIITQLVVAHFLSHAEAQTPEVSAEKSLLMVTVIMAEFEH